jgi:GTPase SAR1 family protein
MLSFSSSIRCGFISINSLDAMLSIAFADNCLKINDEKHRQLDKEIKEKKNNAEHKQLDKEIKEKKEDKEEDNNEELEIDNNNNLDVFKEALL